MMKIFRDSVAVLLLLVWGTSAMAGVHTWVPRATIQSSGAYEVDQSLPYVTIIGNATNYGPGAFDWGFTEPINNPWAGNGPAAGMYAQRTRALGFASACVNPVISQNAKNTTGTNDSNDRWLAAQEMFNSIQLANLYNFYRQALNIQVILGGVTYNGFKVYYKDGASEVWAVNPGYATSVVKLIDQPLPDSLTPGASAGCMT